MGRILVYYDYKLMSLKNFPTSYYDIKTKINDINKQIDIVKTIIDADAKLDSTEIFKKYSKRKINPFTKMCQDKWLLEEYYKELRKLEISLTAIQKQHIQNNLIEFVWQKTYGPKMMRWLLRAKD